MPRTSAEERAAAFYRARKSPLAPPKRSSAQARAIFREIVEAKPADWFDGSQLQVLADHCEVQAQIIAVLRRLRRVEVGSGESKNIISDLKGLRAVVAVSARQLRLTVQAVVDRHATKAGERAPVAGRDPLIGGAAVRPNGAAM
jgi:hypothetical protein